MHIFELEKMAKQRQQELLGEVETNRLLKEAFPHKRKRLTFAALLQGIFALFDRHNRKRAKHSHMTEPVSET